MAGQAKIGIIMGSQSDWETMQHAAEVLDELGVAHEAQVVSAHRTPERLFEYAKGAEARGLKVIIAGAGGAAHLPGMAAAHDPAAGARRAGRERGAVRAWTSLLSIVQMPGGVPVGTLAIGKAGATNAALLAAAILALADPKLRRAAARRSARSRRRRSPRHRRTAVKRRDRAPPGATIGILGGGQLGRMLAIAARRMGYRVHVLSPDSGHARGPGGGRRGHRRLRRPRRGVARSPARSTS